MKKLFLLTAIAAAFILCSCKKEVIKPVNSDNYKVYTAYSNQALENVPEMTIQENTLGNIQWEYSSPGLYYGKLSGAFPEPKTHLSCNNGIYQGISADMRWIDESTIELRTFSAGEPSNGCGMIYFEVRVYE